MLYVRVGACVLFPVRSVNTVFGLESDVCRFRYSLSLYLYNFLIADVEWHLLAPCCDVRVGGAYGEFIDK